jgi:hypothetical protein
MHKWRGKWKKVKYSASVSGSKFHSCSEPIFVWQIVSVCSLSELSSSSVVFGLWFGFVSDERRYVPMAKLFGDAGQNCRQLGG